MIEFSVPLIFSDDFIKRATGLNKEVKKSKITSVYNCFPINLENKCGFEQVRVYSYPNIKNEKDFFQHVKAAQDAGFKFIYLLNSPKGYSPLEFYKKSEQIDRFMENLLKNNVNTVRIANTQLIDYVTTNYPEIEIRTSTSQEYSSIRQYRNLFAQFPKITEIVPSWDLNRNFTFLKNFKNAFDKDIELMVNEGCLPGCPFRTNHNCALTLEDEDPELRRLKVNPRFAVGFKMMCEGLYYDKIWENIMLSNIIYPWDIETYVTRYGINKFKLVGRNADSVELRNGEYFNIYESYLKGIDDYDYIADIEFKKFNHYITMCEHPNFNLKVADVRKLLPNISYFEKNGHKCMNVCGVDCRYCFSLAEKINELYPFK